MIYAVVAASAIAFAPPASLHHATAVRASTPVMAEQSFGRRELFAAAAGAAAFAPLAAFADGASSPAVLERARSIYGSRVFRLQKSSAADILEEKNVFTLFRTGAYRSAAFKDTTKELASIEKKIVKAAKAGDSAGAQAAIKDFIKIGDIREIDIVDGGNFNPKQRRNPGAPPTAEMEAQMGTQKFALYQPLKDK